MGAVRTALYVNHKTMGARTQGSGPLKSFRLTAGCSMVSPDVAARRINIVRGVVCVPSCRNPLLHFSHALYRHITQDHKLPLVLLLNKCDLLPAAAAAAWQQWLQQQLPGVTVIPVSAAKEQAAATARAVLSAVLQQDVMQGGRRVPVQELVGLSLGA